MTVSLDCNAGRVFGFVLFNAEAIAFQLGILFGRSGSGTESSHSAIIRCPRRIDRLSYFVCQVGKVKLSHAEALSDALDQTHWAQALSPAFAAAGDAEKNTIVVINAPILNIVLIPSPQPPHARHVRSSTRSLIET